MSGYNGTGTLTFSETHIVYNIGAYDGQFAPVSIGGNETQVVHGHDTNGTEVIYFMTPNSTASSVPPSLRVRKAVYGSRELVGRLGIPGDDPVPERVHLGDG